MRRYRLSEAAERDYTTLYVFGLEQFGYPQAERYLDELEETFQRLAAFPEMGRLGMEFRPPVRIHVFRAHLIFFDIVDEGVLIQRIRHHTEDWQND
ncbi:MAG TPA: type II toxin-antitoxin system RelE/ParE family toxin [Asticcacaulis sp.]|nr:type II toxin-antitoxin system RelE/ParE family toxin [Asticcacaulis sp.]